MADWVDFMDAEIIPFLMTKGMVIVGSFVAEKEKDLYIWIRRFENAEEQKKIYTAVYDDPYWTNVLSPKAGEIIDRENIVVTHMLPTRRSVIQ